ncbi:uncharacterized protein LOC130138955 [Syzygium oleosum]|uniref:uncharacterized protein LOC130138955 n=1 Tax=Syzygium oleosum TaxID=219896 RepID=UPI0024B8EF4E|nr:uncharacterized protein LOC130138955 [Syzygium oleosum]
MGCFCSRGREKAKAELPTAIPPQPPIYEAGSAKKSGIGRDGGMAILAGAGAAVVATAAVATVLDSTDGGGGGGTDEGASRNGGGCCRWCGGGGCGVGGTGGGCGGGGMRRRLRGLNVSVCCRKRYMYFMLSCWTDKHATSGLYYL